MNSRFFTDGMVKLDDHRHLADLTFTRESQAGVRSREQDLFRYSYNWLFNDPWFFAGGFSAERDPIRDLNHRYIVSASIDNQEIISGRSNTFFKTSTGVNYEITDLLYVSLSLDFDYESDSALDADNEDLAFLLGIGLEFE
jgi:hypothetical protein